MSESLSIINNLDKGSIIIIVLVVILLIVLFIKKQYNIFIEAIRNSETALNSQKGQEKLDYAVKYVQDKLPIILRLVMTKKAIVNIIEYLLNKGLQYMGSEEKIDIKGNE